MKQPNTVFLHMFDWFIMVSHLVLPAARGRVERCYRTPPTAACAAVDAWGEVRRRCRHRDTPHCLLLPLKKFGADPLLVVVSPPPPLPRGGRHPPPRRSRPPFQSDDLLLSLPPSLPPESRGVRLHGEGIVLLPPHHPGTSAACSRRMTTTSKPCGASSARRAGRGHGSGRCCDGRMCPHE